MKYLYFVSNDGALHKLINDGRDYSHIDYPLRTSKAAAWAEYINTMEIDVERDVEALKYKQLCLDHKEKMLAYAKEMLIKQCRGDDSKLDRPQ